ncbi:MAG: SpoIIE family protein phosphatase [Planctomycetota bacterium]
MTPPHVLVVLAADTVPPALRGALERVGCSASFRSLSAATRLRTDFSADALVVVLPDAAAASMPLGALLGRLGELPRPTLLVCPGGCTRELASITSLPLISDTGRDERELAVRLETLLELRRPLAALRRDAWTQRRRGDSAARRYAGQLRLASQVQRGFLPQRLPRFDRVSFECLFRPVDYVSGDIYDVNRLDEEHVGIALADASGHGIPAALLTVYIKRALRGKEIGHGTYRVLSPDEVLAALNEDILDARLTECPFVAAVYAVLNIRTLEVRLARAGAPYPLHRTRAGELRVLKVPGGVVGVLPRPRFDVQRIQLAPGDSLLLHTDGLERIITAAPAPTCDLEPLRQTAQRVAGLNLAAVRAMAPATPGRPQEAAVAVAVPVGLTAGANPESPSPAEDDRAAGDASHAVSGRGHPPHTSDNDASDRPDLPPAPTPRVTGEAPVPLVGVPAQSPWHETLRVHGPQVALEQLAGRQRALRRMGFPLDDLTVLAVQVAP